MNETLFYVCGITLAVSAVVVSFLGLKAKSFPGRFFPIVLVWFVVFVGGATTFSVLHAKDLDEEKAAEFEHKNEELEKEQTSEPFEEAEEEGSEVEEEEKAAEAEAGAAGSAEAGTQVFTSAGCASCHTFAAAGATGSVGPNLDESLGPGDDEAAIEAMIVDPNAEIAAGYAEGIMPGNFGETLSSEELADLVAFLYENSPAGE